MHLVANMAEDLKPYLEYLDKEMTIMGILSAFSVAVPALVIDKIAGAKDSTDLAKLWHDQSGIWLNGSAAILIAALFFYRQRSHLAWYYGQIALAQARKSTGDGSVLSWLTEADSWETWLFYREAFVSLAFGFLQFSIAVVQHEFKIDLPRLLTIWLPALGCIGALILQRRVLTKYRYSERPWQDWWSTRKRES